MQNLPEVEPVPVEKGRPERHRDIGGDSAAAVVVNKSTPGDECTVARMAAEVSIEEALDLLLELLLADFNCRVVEERVVELRRRRVADPDAVLELDGEDAAAEDRA